MKPISSYKILFFLLIGISLHIQAQTPNQNYIQSFEVQVAGVADASLTNSTPVNVAVQTIQYYDGIGRLMQTVQKGVTPEGYDVVKPVKYNNLGLDIDNFLPYAVNPSSGSYMSNFESAQPAFYSSLFNGDGNGKSPVQYEASPLNRLLKQGAPGTSWTLDQHPVTFSYLSNNTSDSKLKAVLWKVSGNTCSNTGNYDNNQLYVLKTINENGAENYEFKDKQGRVVLKRSVLDDGVTLVDTYYVYDDFGLLRFVISPEGSIQITSYFTSASDLAKKYVYCYIYDERGRLIEKQIPGKDPEYYVYDKNDKVIFYQDGNMRKLKSAENTAYEWMFTKYDAMGRVIMTGITRKYPSSTRDDLQALANTSSRCWEYLNGDENSYYYSNVSFPAYEISYCSILSINYYDTYHTWKKQGTDFVQVDLNKDNNLNCSIQPYLYDLYHPELLHVAGMPTVSFVGMDNSTTLLAASTYYDTRGRVLQTHSKNHCNGYDHFTNLYEAMTNRILTTEHTHSTQFASANNVSEKITNVYDAMGRLITKRYYFQDVEPKQVTSNTYNTLGQLITKQIGDGTYFMQTVDYQYNIRGWLTKINEPSNVSATGDLFGMEILYNTQNPSLLNERSYNGNISGVIWQTSQPTGTTTPNTTGQKGYRYTYDKMNRLLKGQYYDISSGVWDKYTEQITENTGKSYDLNGNILGIKRNGIKYPNTQGCIDILKYYYDGNRLKAVDDEVPIDNGGDFADNGHNYGTSRITEYAYDANGNVIKDDNKGIVSIIYNNLNLPSSVTKTGGNRIEYVYTATGTKLRQLYYQNGILNKTTNFIGNFVYENSMPSCIVYDEGRVVYRNNTYLYFGEVYLKDHLGNVRVALRRENGVVKVRQVDSYYSFGMNIKELSANNTDVNHPNEYLYNSKMMQDEMSLNWYDYGARFYDPVLGRWHSVDPLAEKGRKWSPYNYCIDNPIRFIDPDGMDWNGPSTRGYDMWGKPEDHPDWVEAANGTVHNDKEVTRKNDPDLKPEEKYIGKTVNGIDSKGNFIYGAQDGKTYTAAPLSGPTITANDPYAGTRHLCQDDKGYGPWIPDGAGAEVGGNVTFMAPPFIPLPFTVSGDIGTVTTGAEGGLYGSFSMGWTAGIPFTGSVHAKAFLLQSTQKNNKNDLSKFAGSSKGSNLDLGLFGGFYGTSTNRNNQKASGYNIYGMSLNVPSSYGASYTNTNTKFLIKF